MRKGAVEVKFPYTLRNQPNLKSLYSKTMPPLKQVNGQVWHEQEASVILSSSNANVCGRCQLLRLRCLEQN